MQSAWYPCAIARALDGSPGSLQAASMVSPEAGRASLSAGRSSGSMRRPRHLGPALDAENEAAASSIAASLFAHGEEDTESEPHLPGGGGRLPEASEESGTHEIATPSQCAPSESQPLICGKDGCTIVLINGRPHSGLCLVPEYRSSERQRQPPKQPVPEAGSTQDSEAEPGLRGAKRTR